jgi:GH43 family beta-xylosidase
MYYTASASGGGVRTHRLFVLENSSKDPTSGRWVNKGKIADPDADYYAIDATVFQYHHDHYLLWSGYASKTDNKQRIYIAKMKNPWTFATSRVLISSPTHSWEGTINEGPEILKNKSGRVFLIFSANGCGSDNYALGMMSLKKGSDPLKASNWTKKDQPVFTKNPSHHAYGPGHNGFFKSPDGTQSWIIYHANPQSGQGCGSHRSTRMQQFHWNKDGTPDFGVPVQIHIPIEVPSRK